MKNALVKLVLCVVVAASLQGCYGKFALTRKVYALNGEVRDKFLRSGLTWVFLIVPVYGVAGLADFVVLNTIEFWSGKNPVAEGEKDFQYVDGVDRFDIHARKQGETVTYTITHYNFDNYVDSLHIDWNATQDSAWSRYASGSTVTETFAERKADGVSLQIRPLGSLPQTLAIAGR
jgi:hypothetical protein